LAQLKDTAEVVKMKRKSQRKAFEVIKMVIL
jgi:hypothetical protein